MLKSSKIWNETWGTLHVPFLNLNDEVDRKKLLQGIERLLEKGADVNFDRDPPVLTHICCSYSDRSNDKDAPVKGSSLEKIVKLFHEKGADVNNALRRMLRDFPNANKRNFELAEILLDCGIDINQKRGGKTLLHHFVDVAERVRGPRDVKRDRDEDDYIRRIRKYEICKAWIDFLLKHGANTKIKDENGQIPSGLTTDPEIQKMLEAYEQRSNRGLKDFLATKASKLDKVSEKAKETLKKKGLTGKALHDAAQKERLKVSKAILKQRQTTK